MFATNVRAGAPSGAADSGLEGLLAGLSLAQPDQATRADSSHAPAAELHDSPAPLAAAQPPSEDGDQGMHAVPDSPQAAEAGAAEAQAPGAALEMKMAQLALAQPDQAALAQGVLLPGAQPQAEPQLEGAPGAAAQRAAAAAAEPGAAKLQRRSSRGARESGAAGAAADMKPKRASAGSRGSLLPGGQENRDSSNVGQAPAPAASKKAAAPAEPHAGAAVPAAQKRGGARSGVAAMRQFWEATAQKGERPGAGAQALPHAVHAKDVRGGAAVKSSVQDWSDDD